MPRSNLGIRERAVHGKGNRGGFDVLAEGGAQNIRCHADGTAPASGQDRLAVILDGLIETEAALQVHRALGRIHVDLFAGDAALRNIQIAVNRLERRGGHVAFAHQSRNRA